MAARRRVKTRGSILLDPKLKRDHFLDMLGRGTTNLKAYDDVVHPIILPCFEATGFGKLRLPHEDQKQGDPEYKIINEQGNWYCP